MTNADYPERTVTTVDATTATKQERQQQLQQQQQEQEQQEAKRRKNALVRNGAKEEEERQEDNVSDYEEEDDHGDAAYLEEEVKTGWHRQVENFNRVRYVTGGIVNNNHVQVLVVLLISVNAIMMGIGTFDFVNENPQINSAFEKTDKAFLIIFTVEMVMQFVYHGWRLLLDGWLVFDLFIIVTSWSFSQIQIIRAFRIFRALRLITRVKVMKNLLLALFSVMPRMLAIFVLLMLIMYIFAVMFTQMFKDFDHMDAVYFAKLDETLFTLFQIMTMESWSNIARQVMDVPGYGWAWMPFIAFVILTGYIVVNLIIAVICDAVSALHDDDKAKLLGMYDETNDSLDEGNSNADEQLSDEMNTQHQMEVMQDYIGELGRIQAQTLETLEYLTLQLHLKNMEQQQQAQTQTQSKNEYPPPDPSDD